MTHLIGSRIVSVCALAVVCAVTAHAQTRTTPVTINASGNTVKAEQSGAWNVGVTGTPNVNVTNTPSVSVANTPSVNVANTPTVSVGNSPTVKIDAAVNTIKAPTQSSMIQPWTGDQSVGPHGYLYTPTVYCGGYKEIRVVIKCSAAYPDAKVYYRCKVGNYWVAVGSATWAAPDHSITDHANFSPLSDTCIFTVPVMSDQCDFYVYNNSATAACTIRPYTWIYLVN